MLKSKLLASLTVAARIAISGGSILSAQERFGEWREQQQYVRQDMRGDYGRIERLREAVARDRFRVNEDERSGRRWAARRDANQLARDGRALEFAMSDVRHDRRFVR